MKASGRVLVVAGAALVALATVPWLFVRQSLVPTGWLVVVLAGIGAVVAWRRRRPGAAPAVRLLAGALSVGALARLRSATVGAPFAAREGGDDAAFAVELPSRPYLAVRVRPRN